MRPGVGYPSYSSKATWANSSGFTDANYPPTNISDTLFLSKVARAAATGTSVVQFTFPSAKSIQFVAIANHNLDAAATMRVQLFSDNAFTTSVADTGTISVFPSGSAPVLKPDGTALYRQTRPVILTSAVSVQSGKVTVTSSVVKPEIGAVELAGWWQWLGISWGRELGIDSREPSVDLAGGASHTYSEFAPRQINGQMDYILTSTTDPYTLLDFQKANDVAFPFCFVHDADDSTTWPRLCMMATNTQLPPLVGAAYRADRIQFKFNEHMR